mmetsp:Transcript_7892/g.20291  ORF Transcript_7892/g.20291 Transcript_7892/m.20291 type:complete len:248 (+) Transcript_7892:2-745(+)
MKVPPAAAVKVAAAAAPAASAAPAAAPAAPLVEARALPRRDVCVDRVDDGVDVPEVLRLGGLKGGRIRRRPWEGCVLVAAHGAEDAKAQAVHVALLDVIVRVLEGAVRLLACAVFEQCAADRHPRGVKLVQEAAAVALHAEVAQPVGTDRLPEVLLVAGGNLRATASDVGRLVRGHTRHAGVHNGGGQRRRIQLVLEVEGKVIVRHGGAPPLELFVVVGGGGSRALRERCAVRGQQLPQSRSAGMWR